VASDRVQWLHRQIERYNAGDLDGFLDALDSGFTFTPDPSFPDVDTYGGEDLRRWMGEWTRMWGESRLEVLGTTEVGHAVVVDSRWHLTASATGQAIPIEDFRVVVWFDGDRAQRAAAFFDENRALEAAREAPG
jgi:hypothetical protein